MTLADSLKARCITLGTSLLDIQSQWYHGGTFYNPFGNQWEYTSSPIAALCASMWRATGDSRYLRICIESFDYAVDNLMGFDGANIYYIGEPGSSTTDLEINVFCGHIGWAMFVAGDDLGHDRRAKWMRAVKGSLEHAELVGNLIWFENGNWVANKVRMLYFAKELCRRMRDDEGYARYDGFYERGYTLMINPVSFDARWAGYGQVIDTPGGWADKSDEISHLTELAGGPPIPNAGAGTSSDGQPPFSTYDGDYAHLAIEHLCSWFVASRDVRALRVLNGYTNKYMSTVDTTTWIGDFSHGSRHDAPGNGVSTPALAVIALLGSRLSTTTNFTDAKVLDHWDNRVIQTLNSGYLPGRVQYAIARSWVNVIGTILYACEQSVAVL